MKYKVGDKVKVKSWDQLAKEYGPEDEEGHLPNCPGYFNRDMQGYCGKVLTVKSLGIKFFSVFEDAGAWTWAREMFEDEDNHQSHKFKVGDKIIVKNPGCCGDMSTKKGRIDRIYPDESIDIIDEKGYSWAHSEECLELDEPAFNPQCEHFLDTIKRELEEEGFIHSSPGMYVTYQGPKMGEILRSSLVWKRNY